MIFLSAIFWIRGHPDGPLLTLDGSRCGDPLRSLMDLAAQNQAADRAQRIGQLQCVQVYKLIAKDTI